MIIDYRLVPEDHLLGLIDEYCLREWGLNDVEDPIDARRKAVRRKLEDRELLVMTFERQSPCLASAEGLDPVKVRQAFEEGGAHES